MNIEEKAKAYDEAIRKAHKLCAYPTTKPFISDLQDLFPELKELEDERIREKVITTIHLYYGEPLEDEAKEMIAWLEKQGEHANFRNKIQVGDKVTRNRDGVLVNLSQLKRVAKPAEKQGNNMGISEATKQKLEDNLNKALEKETPESCNEFLDKQGEQKPAWSEEDETKIKSIIALLKSPALCTMDGNKGIIDESIKYLKSLKNRVQPQLQQEWNEEDEVKDNWELVHEFVNKFGRIPKDEDELSVLVEYVLKRQKSADIIPQDFEKYVEHLLSLSDGEGHGNPAKLKEVCSKLLRLAKLQQKTAWSEEDEKMLNLIIAVFEVNHPNEYFKANELNDPNMRVVYTEEIVTWLKTIKDRVQPQPKQEWSEEEKARIDKIVDVLDWAEEKGYIHYSDWEDYVCYVKSLRPQSTWKPSDEQMKVCKEVYADILSAKGFDLCTVNSELNRLEEQLKKTNGGIEL